MLILTYRCEVRVIKVVYIRQKSAAVCKFKIKRMELPGEFFCRGKV